VTEWKLRAGSVPVAIALALLFHSCDTGHFAQRTALSMPLHELGHAISGWWSGYASLPGLWKTTLPETRGVVMPVLVLAPLLHVHRPRPAQMMRERARERQRALLEIVVMMRREFGDVPRTVLLRCPGGVGCAADASTWQIDVLIRAPVAHYVILVFGDVGPTPDASMDEFLAAARAAHARVIVHPTIDVR